MDPSQIYIIFGIVFLLMIVFMGPIVNVNPKHKRLSPLASLAFILILAGMIFGGNRFIGYGLIGLGLILAVADIYKKSKE